MEQIQVTDWYYCEVDDSERRLFAGKKIDARKFFKKGKKAKVPGSIFLDLERDGKIPDPFYSDNEKQVQWVEEKDWVYSACVDMPADWLKKIEQNPSQWRIHLLFNGIDTFAKIFVNGVLIGSTNNAFIPWRFTLPHQRIIKEGKCTITVFIESAKKKGEELTHKYGLLNAPFDRGRVYIRRLQYLTGWDWGPRLSGASLSGSVQLFLYHFSRIDDLWVRTLKLPQGSSSDTAEIETTVLLETFCEMSALRVEMSIYDPELNAVAKLERVLKNPRPGVQKINFSVNIPSARLWYPRGYGEQPLYTAVVTLSCNGEKLDERSVRFGIRRVHLLQEQDSRGKSFLFCINDRKIFCKGYNWIPADIFPGRLTEEDYRSLLEKVADSNANCLRVWGGGLYEHDAFYSLCDELGILVWQDFMFACAEYPEQEWFLEQVHQEAEKVIRRLRNHPSIILWCGNNENEWIYYMKHNTWKTLPGHKIFDSILPSVCEENDPERPYWQSSPFGGDDPNSPDSGDRHNWFVWSGWMPVEKYLEDTGRFISEFGFQSLPHPQTVRAFAGENYHSLTLTDTPFLAHQKQDLLGNIRLLRYLYDYLAIPSGMDELIYATQVMQAEALKLAVEHWRSLAFHTAGTLIWQFNDCWPAISWSVVDYYRRAKAGWFYARRFFAPVLVTLKRENEELLCSVINESQNELTADLVLQTLTMDGEILCEYRHPVSLPAQHPVQSLSVSLAELKVNSPEKQFVVATLYDRKDSHIICRNICFLARLSRIKWRKPEVSLKSIKIKDGNIAELTLVTRFFAKSLSLYFEGVAPVKISDDYFDLLPGEEKKILVTFSHPVSEKDLRENLRFRCLNDLFLTS
ncbi:glycoside hydrolase family 2 protein [Candidatus Sumerlaeota bacterium]|nr:glycoside hydrolase family 2 protein [Candidatus Sumerlaeota bacterium]